MTLPKDVDVVVVGAGAAGIGTGVALSHLELETVILERDEIGASFRRWPDEMRFITPSFPSNSFELTDLNAVTPNTSPAVTLDREHPSGDEYADYLEAVADFHELSVETGVEVTGLRNRDAETGTTPASTESDAAPAVDGGFVLETTDERVHSESVVWATGQFGSPRQDVFPGADACSHTSEVSRGPTTRPRAVRTTS
ncbi:NAD(P)-binding domain-containing protein [Natronorubrum thiooxidans]|uniref:Pyridine nucleotide-disulphide oxidoreductase n=1 Tax=Natronorubrum thiooxidans TaxID=308853 RepID=A0A1N7H4V5_9EURY|nr:NAD(P)-binding domain-containing protein [Natronorubrum thiooxidans]SIS19885.1 Pyridine nucleotide-disulphide oxidoreductase [Natronorubrum thiooxidans]